MTTESRRITLDVMHPSAAWPLQTCIDRLLNGDPFIYYETSEGTESYERALIESVNVTNKRGYITFEVTIVLDATDLPKQG